MASNQNISNNITNPNYVFNNLNQFHPTDVIYHYVNHTDFSEDFIVDNFNYFSDTIEIILKSKEKLSDIFFEKICTKSNYSKFKSIRKLLEPTRSFKNLDNLFY